MVVMHRILYVALIALVALTPGCTSIADFGEESGDQIAIREPYPLAFHTSFYSQGISDITFTFINPGVDDRILRASAWYDEYSSRAVTTVPIPPDEKVELDVMIVLNEEKVRAITTTTLFNLAWAVEEWDGESFVIIEEGTTPIEVYPMDTMVWEISDGEGGVIDTVDYIAVFVTPQSPAIRDLLVASKEYVDPVYDPMYETLGLSRTLAAYQFDPLPEEAWWIHTNLHAKAVYNALKYTYDVRYLDMTMSFGKQGYVQRVNTPEESLRSKSANCVDGSVLFASALEAMGVNTYIVCLPTHVYVAWKHDPSPAIAPGYENPDSLPLLTADDLTALETTMIGNDDFGEAVTYANEQLRRDWQLFNDFENPDAAEYRLIDIGYAREEGIYPLK
jgi:transglutaminase-like putative cysteine protease